MLFISSKFIKVLMALSLGLPFVANANDHLKPVNGFNRDMKQVDISKIDHEMFKVNFGGVLKSMLAIEVNKKSMLSSLIL